MPLSQLSIFRISATAIMQALGYTPANAASIPSTVPVSQTVLSGSVDANGQANFLSAGSGLSVNLAATAVPINVAFAAGFGSTGLANYVGTIPADITGAWSGLTANTTNYLYIDRNISTGVLDYGATTLAPIYSTVTPGWNVAASGFAIQNGTGTNPANAFDGAPSGSYWDSGTLANNGASYLGQNFGAGNEMAVNKVILNQDTDSAHYVTSVKIQRSPDGATWTDVSIATVGPGGNVIALANTTAYRYWRVLCNSALTAGGWRIFELQMLAPTTGSHWFDLSAFKMKSWNGSSWDEKQRVFVGEAVTGASTITSVISYALQGRYDSGWFAVAANTNYTKNHNLGIALPDGVDTAFYFSTTGDNTDASTAHDLYNASSADLGHFVRENVAWDTRNKIGIGFNVNVQYYRSSIRTSGYYRIVASRKW